MADLKLGDLWETCAKCGGTGKISERQGSMFNSYQMDGDCSECGGRRGKVTPTGDAILEFIRKLKQASLI